MEVVESTFSKKLVKALELNELEVGRLYLARFRYNSKKITWEPCRVISTQPEKTPNGSFDCIRVEFLDPARESWAYVNMVDGKMLMVDGARDASLKEVDLKWVMREGRKAEEELERAEARFDLFEKLAIEVDTRTE